MALLAIGLVLTSAAAVAGVTVLATSVTASMAFVLGSILASTDPVAVTALGRSLPLPPRLATLVRAESLFNDATSLVLVKVAVGVAVVGGGVSWSGSAGELLVLAGGGALIGLLAAGAVARLRARTEDVVLETVIYLVTPYLAYVLAESAHASGVTAVVVAGVLLGGPVAGKITTAPTRLQLHAVSGTLVLLLESVVFGLIGLQLPALWRDLDGTAVSWVLPVLAVTGTMLALRLVWIYPLHWVMQHRRGRSTRPSWRVPLVVTWAGARGVLPLAAALSIPLTASDGSALPHREVVQFLSVAVIVLTLVAQGLSLEPLVRRAGVALGPEHAADEEDRARAALTAAALRHLDQVADLEAAPEAVVSRVRRGLETVLDSVDGKDQADLRTYHEVRRDLIGVESAELRRLYESGAVSDDTRRRLQHELDQRHVGFGPPTGLAQNAGFEVLGEGAGLRRCTVAPAPARRGILTRSVLLERRPRGWRETRA